jgi:hypothetical protein
MDEDVMIEVPAGADKIPDRSETKTPENVRGRMDPVKIRIKITAPKPPVRR